MDGAVDLLSVRVTATGSALSRPARLKSLSWLCAGTAASQIVFRDGGASGTVKLTIDGSATANYREDMFLPENGVRFTTDMYVTLTNVTALTILYD